MKTARLVLLFAIFFPSLARAQYAEDTNGIGLRLGPVDLSLHGYFRAPLRLSWRDRGASVMPGEAQTTLHSPWLIDDDYYRSGFAYTRIQEQDYSELFFSVGNKNVVGTVAIMGSLFSDSAQAELDKQMGIAQGFLTLKWEKDAARYKLKVQAKGGAFWDKFGWLENYDTYLFGRTHQLGAQGRIELDLDKWSMWLLYGFGTHLEAIDLNEGLTFLNYLHAGVSFKDRFKVGLYFLDAFTHDKRQLSPIADADEQVLGIDASFQHPLVGRFYAGYSMIDASQADYLSPAIEVMHAFGGRGLTENFLGTDSSDHGTGSLYNIAFEHKYSVKAVLNRYAPNLAPALGRGDFTLKWFGLYSYVNSHQMSPDPMVNKDQRQYFKWGVEPAYQPLSWLAFSVRYDRVILDLDDDANSFRVISPKVMLMVHWLVDAQIYLQYSHYIYGGRALLREGQVALETQPDTDVFKVQAQIAF